MRQTRDNNVSVENGIFVVCWTVGCRFIWGLYYEMVIMKE